MKWRQRIVSLFKSFVSINSMSMFIFVSRPSNDFIIKNVIVLQLFERETKCFWVSFGREKLNFYSIN